MISMKDSVIIFVLASIGIGLSIVPEKVKIMKI
jgi:hypothetical protein